MKYSQAQLQFVDFDSIPWVWTETFLSAQFCFAKTSESSEAYFQGLGSSTTSKRWSKHFHLKNGCSHLNDLTGTSSLLTEAGYYKECVIHIWAVLKQLYQVQEHRILSIHVYSPESAVEATMQTWCMWRDRQHNRCSNKYVASWFNQLLNENTMLAYGFTYHIAVVRWRSVISTI